MKKIGLLLLVLCSGCATTTDRFKLVSTEVNPGTVVGDKLVQGESCKKSILFIPLDHDGSLESAVEDALQKNPGANALADLKVRRKTLITVLYNYRCISVEGKPVRI